MTDASTSTTQTDGGKQGAKLFGGLFRVFSYERINWRRVVALSGLPDDAQNLILTVVKKSRLMWFEKFEVVQELIAHFQDGALAGQTCQQLIKQFGEPLVTARLIRRSKIRNRPMMLKAIQITGWCALAAIGCYLAVSGYYYAGVPTPNVDYVVELNRSVSSVDDSDKAWPIYRPMWIKYGFSEVGGFAREQMPFMYHQERAESDPTENSRLVKPGDPEWPAAIAKLDEWSDLLASFRAGAKKRRLGLELQADPNRYSDEDLRAIFPNRKREEIGPDVGLGSEHSSSGVQEALRGSLISILLPHIQVFRNAARIFQVDTRWAMEQHDSQRALSNIETMLGLAEQAAGNNVLVGSLVGFAIHRMAINTLEEILVAEPDFFDEQQLERLQRRIEKISIRQWIQLDGERAMMYDMAQRIYTDNGHGDGRITPIGMEILETSLEMKNRPLIDLNVPEFRGLVDAAKHIAAPASVFVLASRRETIDTYDKLMSQIEADLDRPLWESNHMELECASFLIRNKRKHYVLTGLFPAMSAVRNAMHRAEAHQEATIAMLAMNRYFLRYGQWPDSLEQLAPEFVSELPVDLMDGNFIKFKISGAGPVIYSIGYDRDDDGGKALMWSHDLHEELELFLGRYSSGWDKSQNTSVPDGDVILWPLRTEF
jgi:hypothetical protein